MNIGKLSVSKVDVKHPVARQENVKKLIYGSLTIEEKEVLIEETEQGRVPGGDSRYLDINKFKEKLKAIIEKRLRKIYGNEKNDIEALVEILWEFNSKSFHSVGEILNNKSKTMIKLSTIEEFFDKFIVPCEEVIKLDIEEQEMIKRSCSHQFDLCESVFFEKELSETLFRKLLGMRELNNQGGLEEALSEKNIESSTSEKPRKNLVTIYEIHECLKEFIVEDENIRTILQGKRDREEYRQH